MAVHSRCEGAITVVTLDRPGRRNAVDRHHADALSAAFRAFDADPGQSVAILHGAGGTFCAGADLQAIAAGHPNRVEPEGDGPMGPTRMRLGKPVIAAIEGYAVAGGLELAIWCDLRVVAEDAVLGVFCRRFGVPLIDGGTVRLPRLIGEGRALDLILTGRPVGAEEALQMGLVNRVCASGAALQTALELARSLCALPQICLRGDRMSVLEQADFGFAAAMANELNHGRQALAAEGFSGAKRFAEGAGRSGQSLSGPPEGD